MLRGAGLCVRRGHRPPPTIWGSGTFGEDGSRGVADACPIGISAISGRAHAWRSTGTSARCSTSMPTAPGSGQCSRPNLPTHEWSYPPSIILFGAPLALMPVLPAYLVWTFGTVVLLHLAIRPLRLPTVLHLATLASPAVFINAMFGQNGALTAALLIGGMLAAPKRPIFAGVLFGLLTVKPHLGILIPFCLIASHNWRAFVGQLSTASAFCRRDGDSLRFRRLGAFLVETRPLMTAIMEAPYPQTTMATRSRFSSWPGQSALPSGTAYVTQAVAALAAMAASSVLAAVHSIDHRRRDNHHRDARPSSPHPMATLTTRSRCAWRSPTCSRSSRKPTDGAAGRRMAVSRCLRTG